jgi:hypothetical protein
VRYSFFSLLSGFLRFSPLSYRSRLPTFTDKPFDIIIYILLTLLLLPQLHPDGGRDVGKHHNDVHAPHLVVASEPMTKNPRDEWRLMESGVCVLFCPFLDARRKADGVVPSSPSQLLVRRLSPPPQSAPFSYSGSSTSASSPFLPFPPLLSKTQHSLSALNSLTSIWTSLTAARERRAGICRTRSRRLSLSRGTQRS